MASPTQRTLTYLRKQGYMVGIVEKYNRFAHVRQDLFNFIDLVAVLPGEKGCLAVQATAGYGDVNRRVEKIRDLPLVELSGKKRHRAKVWLRAGNRILVIGWNKKGARGKRKTWTPNEKWLTLEDL